MSEKSEEKKASEKKRKAKQRLKNVVEIYFGSLSELNEKKREKYIRKIR